MEENVIKIATDYWRLLALSAKIANNLEMTDDKKKLIYSMLLNIQENVNNVVKSFDEKNTDWNNILTILDESEAEMVYILKNAKSEIEKQNS